MRSLVGCISDPFLHRRGLLSLLSEILGFTQNMKEQKQQRRPAFVIDEILLCAALLPLAESDIRNPVSTNMSATDATPVRAGRCQATIPGEIARALYRHAERRGEHGRLDWSEIETALLPMQMTPTSADLDELLTSLPWEGGLGYDYRNSAHISI